MTCAIDGSTKLFRLVVSNLSPNTDVPLLTRRLAGRESTSGTRQLYAHSAHAPPVACESHYSSLSQWLYYNETSLAAGRCNGRSCMLAAGAEHGSWELRHGLQELSACTMVSGFGRSNSIVGAWSCTTHCRSAGAPRFGPAADCARTGWYRSILQTKRRGQNTGGGTI